MMMKKNKILVVDDDLVLRKTLADILMANGYDVVLAGTGAEAIVAAERNTFNLALIDLVLPDFPGLEVMARIKAISPLTETIILTGHASMDTAIEATRQGAYSYLLKPYQMDELLRSIQHGVESQKTREELLRLASFPRLHPSPVIELNTTGAVTYANPAAEKLFPDLRLMGVLHPLLRGLSESIAELQKNGYGNEISIEAKVSEATYELHISYLKEISLIRIYVIDITQRKRNEAEIHLLATTDSLTGILNRREFSRILANEVDRAKRYGMPLSLVMYDLDHFKHVNDTFGHDVGDVVLRAVTALVTANVRTVDVVARWGGEEFMVLMPQSSLAAASSVAEKLRLTIAQYCFEQVGTITVSFGVTEYAPQDDTNSLLKRVDDALYLAKDRGRNRVETLIAGTEAAAEAIKI